MAELRPVRVCLDARGIDATWGGVRQTIIGLADGLSRLTDGDETYSFLVERGADDWLRPYVRGSCEFLYVEPRTPARTPRWRRAVRPLVPRRVTEIVTRAFRRSDPVEVPPSDGKIEEARIDVMHFTTQRGFRTSVPTIYVPHDLQHIHHPEFFTAAQLRGRAVFYPVLARQAQRVVALSHHGKADITAHLGVPPDRVSVIGWAPVIDAYETPSERDLARTRATLRLPDRFALYPAQTWPHKNHLGLLEAVSLLKARGLEVPVVCPGTRIDFYRTVARRARKLRVDRLVHFIDFVSSAEIHALYRAARLLVFPSLFEGFGMPVVEAFRAGIPVACSNTTSLPEVSAGCALLFDPLRPDDIANAMQRLWTDDGLRSSLVARAQAHVALLDWRGVARRYRALYRTVACRATDEDRAIATQLR